MKACGCKRGSAGGVLERLFMYETNKKVLIKDPILGSMHAVVLAAALLYLLAWRMVAQQGYIAREPLVGLVETTLRAPSRLQDASALPYCDMGPGGVSVVLPCVTGPDAWVSAPSRGDDELFVATRLSYQGDGMAANHSFVRNPEDYTVDLAFIAQALQLYHTTGNARYSKHLQDLSTQLVDEAGTPYRSVPTRTGRFDIFTVRDLLEAAGVRLDSPAPVDRGSTASISNSDTIRHVGVVLLLSIDCRASWTGSLNSCQYKVRRVSHMEGKADLSADGQEAAGGNHRRQLRRGIKILVSCSGYMGRFDLSEVLLSIASAVALLEVLAFALRFAVTRLLAHLLPYGEVYRMLMYDESLSFQGLREGCPRASRSFRALQASKRELSGELPVEPSAEASPEEASGNGSGKIPATSREALAEVRQRLQRAEARVAEAERRAAAAEAAAQPAQFVAQQALSVAHAALASSRPGSPASSTGGPPQNNAELLGLQGVAERVQQQVARAEEKVVSLQTTVGDAGKHAKAAHEVLQREETASRRLEARVAHLERALGSVSPGTPRTPRR